MKVHVICCNDSIEVAFLGSEEEATKKLEKLAEKDYNKRGNWTSYEYYRDINFWHLHTVDLLTNPDEMEVM